MHDKEFKVVSDYLTECYENGFIGALFDLQGQGIPLCFPMDQQAMVRAVQLDSKISRGLYTRLGEDVAMLKKRITAEVSRGISAGMTFKQVAQQLAAKTKIGYNNAVRIARTEGHRINSQSTMDACYKAKDKGADVVKQWDATLDDRTRESHQAVDGEVRELDEKFSNGLMFPGDPSGGAAEVCNCRCALLQRARWALDKDELETLKERAAYFGLDKSKNFDDFKKKYIEISKIADYNNSRKKIDLQFFANRSIVKQSDRQIMKSISSWKANIAEHEDKIKNPAKYDRDWDSKTEVQKAGLIRHWKKEVRHFDDNIKEAEAELAKRMGAQ
jgi:SPP1 gp7 family putative phage head morphogenesis protein